jgi:uncharacterized protein with GYD domain
MHLYMHQAAYTPESIAAQIRNPEDRLEVATRPTVEAAGGKFIAGGFSFGEYDLVALFEAPDDVSAATVSLAVSAGGALKAVRTTRLLGGAEWVEALKRTPSVSSHYQPALVDDLMADENSVETARERGYL